MYGYRGWKVWKADVELTFGKKAGERLTDFSYYATDAVFDDALVYHGLHCNTDLCETRVTRCSVRREDGLDITKSIRCIISLVLAMLLLLPAQRGGLGQSHVARSPTSCDMNETVSAIKRTTHQPIWQRYSIRALQTPLGEFDLFVVFSDEAESISAAGDAEVAAVEEGVAFYFQNDVFEGGGGRVGCGWVGEFERSGETRCRVQRRWKGGGKNP